MDMVWPTSVDSWWNAVMYSGLNVDAIVSTGWTAAQGRMQADEEFDDEGRVALRFRGHLDRAPIGSPGNVKYEEMWLTIEALLREDKTRTTIGIYGQSDVFDGGSQIGANSYFAGTGAQYYIRFTYPGVAPEYRSALMRPLVDFLPPNIAQIVRGS